jgi:hypothetical protein
VNGEIFTRSSYFDCKVAWMKLTSKHEVWKWKKKRRALHLLQLLTEGKAMAMETLPVREVLLGEVEVEVLREAKMQLVTYLKVHRSALRRRAAIAMMPPRLPGAAAVDRTWTTWLWVMKRKTKITKKKKSQNKLPRRRSRSRYPRARSSRDPRFRRPA